MARFECPGCGFTLEEMDSIEGNLSCPRCGSHFEKEPSKEERVLSGFSPSLSIEEPEPEEHQYALKFTGTAEEYFRIWIVNVFLTAITLGIYAAWAKVRTRQYFYANTTLADQSFEFTGNPGAILKGNLIVGGGFIAYMLIERIIPFYSAPLIIAFYLFFPFLIYKSLRFNTKNTTFRNIRFRFLGTVKESYKTYLLFPLLIPLTLGFIVPYWAYRRKRYFFNNLAFGSTCNSFAGLPGPFYRVYFLAGLMFIGLMVLMGVIFFPLIKAAWFPSPGRSKVTAMVIPFVGYLVMLAAFSSIQQYLHSRLNNYSWGQTFLGKLRFQSTLKARQLIWISITNFLAIVFSLGLLIPWANVRRTRYILENLMVISKSGLDDFTAAVEPDVGAIGDAATDFFDISMGL